MFEWAYGGVNASIPRNMGPECAGYLTMKRRILETAVISLYIISLMSWSLKKIIWPKPMAYLNQERSGRKQLMLLMSLVFGVEIGFKLSGQTFVYILNPCHIITVLQVSHE